MFEFKKKPEVKSDSTQSVTFKITESDKHKLNITAKELGMTLSEYIRLKVMLDENEWTKLIIENRKLKHQIKEYIIKEKIHSSNKVLDGSIVIQSSETGKEVIKQMLNKLMLRNRLLGKEIIESDFHLTKAFSIIITEELATLLDEMDDIRENYEIKSFEDFYSLLFGFYFDSVFNKKA